MYCGNCGKQIEDNAKFCNYCGAKVTEENAKDTMPLQNAATVCIDDNGAKVKKKKGKYAIALLIGLFIGGIYYFFASDMLERSGLEYKNQVEDDGKELKSSMEMAQTEISDISNQQNASQVEQVESMEKSGNEETIVFETAETKARAALASLEIWDGSIAESFDGGDGSAENPYQIANGAQLAKLANDTNQGVGFSNIHFILTKDIVLNDISKWDFDEASNNTTLYFDGWNDWCPIGARNGNAESGYQFRGSFDGGGYTVYGLYSDISLGDGSLSLSTTGLFGCVYKGSVLNLNLACCILAPYNSGNIGGVIGILDYGVIENCHTQQMIIDGTSCRSVDSWGIKIGCICGDTTSAEIVNCSSSGLISYEKRTDANGNPMGNRNLYIGGIAGDATSEESQISDCFSECTICINTDIASEDSNEYFPPSICVGGICGRGYSITSCYSENDLSIEIGDALTEEMRNYAIAVIGGIVGHCTDNVINCGTRGSLYVSGEFEETYPGGIAGVLGTIGALSNTPGFNQLDEAEASFCYADMKMDSENPGGIAGCAYGYITVKNCYYNGNYSQRAVPVMIDSNGNLFTDQTKALSENEMSDSLNFYNWDFELIWHQDEKINNGLPIPTTVIDFLR